MSESKFYHYYHEYNGSYEEKEYWKVNKQYNLQVNAEFKLKQSINAYVGRFSETDDRIPKSFETMKYKRVKEEVFNEYFNANYSRLQKVNINGGEYFLERDEEGERYIFYAYRDKPALHCEVTCRQTIEGSDFSVHFDKWLTRRQFVRKKAQKISEEAFCQVFKLVMDYLYDGAAMPTLQDQLFKAIEGLAGPDAPKDEIIINQETNYQKARSMMVKRKDELKARLIELDDKPSTRRELRAQMKAIDYCISVLDNNH